MQHLSKTPRQKLVSLAGGPMCVGKKSMYKAYEGIINFSPFCSITADSSMSQSPEVLIQAPVASHRRARTPVWTYLFFPTETHIDLHISLPTAVLLREVQLQPHAPSLVTSPSAVALEITRDNGLPPIPISQPMSTVGLTCIRLRLAQPEIASSIVLRLYRPKDSNSLGLTQISVIGSTVFTRVPMQCAPGSGSTMAIVNNNLAHVEEDIAAKSSLDWLRILARCFSVATAADPSSGLPAAVIQSAAAFPGFLEASCALLNVTPVGPNSALQNLETVLLKLGLFSRDLGLKLIETLLRNTQPQTFRLCNDAVSDLLFDLCTTKDEYTCDRIAVIITWIQNFYGHEAARPGVPSSMRSNPYSGFVKCLAAVLWSAYHAGLETELQSLITEEFFGAVFVWSTQLRDKEPLKQAIDALLCSICCIRPELFPHLLQRMGVLIAKETTGTKDYTKRYNNLAIQDITQLALTPVQLKTIAMACQSPLAIAQLLDSGLPYLLSIAILFHCSNRTEEEHNSSASCSTAQPSTSASVAAAPLVNVDMISEILDFFSETCSEGTMRDWLGSQDGSLFWSPLLNMLCNDRPSNDGGSSDRMLSFSKLEAATIHFLSRVTACHPQNQDHLTMILIAVIRKPAPPPAAVDTPATQFATPKNIISGFTRRLVLQLLLESERILVAVRSEHTLQKQDDFTAPINHHPSKRANAHHMLFYVSTHTKCQDIQNSCTHSAGAASGADGGSGSSACMNAGLADIVMRKMPSWTDKPMGGSCIHDLGISKKDYLEFGLGSGMEFLSVAAGVTAKDKRVKDEKNKAAAAAAAALKNDVFAKYSTNSKC